MKSLKPQKQRSLYQFRARPKKSTPFFPPSYCVEYLATDECEKEYGMRVDAIIYAGADDDLYALIETNEQFDAFGKKLVERYKTDPSYLENLLQWSESVKSSLRDYLKTELSADSIRKLNTEDLVKKYSKYTELYRDFHFKNTPSWWVGSDAVGKALRAALKQKKVVDVDHVLELVTAALQYQTDNQEEEYSLLDIVEALQEQKIAKVTSREELPELIQKMFAQHVDDFSSIPFSYRNDVVWDDAYFIKKINELLALPKQVKEIKAEKAKALAEKKQKQKEFIASLKLDQPELNLVDAIHKLYRLQELKKTTQTRSHPYLRNVVFAEFSRRLGQPIDFFHSMTLREVTESLRAGNISDKLNKDILARIDSAVLIAKDNNYEWLVGDDAEEFLRVNKLRTDIAGITEIKGMVASRGRVRGRVKVCHLSTQTGKIEQGDILVTAMTTPDFVPSMRKAAAVITDEGGITCHAAIVSRELGIPCVISTKIATKVLKDGDMVEVDAEKGIVTILK